jgi:hypothetical protein
MKKRRALGSLALGAVLVVSNGPALLAGPQLGRTGSSTSTPPGVPVPGQLTPPAPSDPAQAIYVHHMIDFQMIKRFRQVQQDTSKLLELTKQLEDSTSKAAAANSSGDVQHQAAQIEKLAKSINQNTRE